MTLLRDRLFKTAKSRLATTLAAFQLGCAFPEWLVFAYGLHSDDKLSIGLGMYVAVVCIIANAIAGLLFWFTVVEPILKKRMAKAP